MLLAASKCHLSYELTDRRDVVLVSSGLWRFQGLTQWQFLTIGVYFGFTSALTFLGMRVPPEAREHEGWHILSRGHPSSPRARVAHKWYLRWFFLNRHHCPIL